MGVSTQSTWESSSYSALHYSNKMDSKLVFPAALLVLFCLIDAGLSDTDESNVLRGTGEKSTPLKCYQCNSYKDAHCADPFYHDDDPDQKRAKDPKMLKPCENGETFCRKIYQNVRGDERVIRSCGSVRDEKERDCYTTVLEEYNTLVCQCDNEDGCNSGNMFKVSSLAVLSAVLLAYLIH